MYMFRVALSHEIAAEPLQNIIQY